MHMVLCLISQRVIFGRGPLHRIQKLSTSLLFQTLHLLILLLKLVIALKGFLQLIRSFVQLLLQDIRFGLTAV